MSSIVEKLQNLRFDMHKRMVIVAVFFFVALVFTAIGVLVIKVDVSDAQDFEEEIMEEFERLNDPRSIFGNNFIHTLVMFVPLFGPVWGCFVLFNTGSIISILSIAQGVPPFLTFLVLFFTPVFWLEFGVYSVAMAQSVVLFLQILRRRGRKEAVRTCVLITICALFLLLAAVIEWVMINMSSVVPA
ncbi:MAG: stage II sporulation protein M [Candidatus Bathyarchaeia archaeon]